MKISVIMAAHNAGTTILRALRSIAAQTHSPHEIIVLDDASSDDTAERVLDSGVDAQLLRVGFRNAAASRNAGMREAQGDWIAFLDADDEWYPAHLETAAATLGANDAAYLAAADYVDVAGQPIPLRLSQPANGATSSLAPTDYISWFRRQSWFCNCTVLLRRSALQSERGFDETLLRRHDLELFLRVIHGKTWAYSPIPAARIQLGTPGSISENRVSADWFFMKALAGLSKKYESEDYRAILRSRACCTLNSALRAGSATDVKEAWRIAHHYLPFAKRLLYRGALQVPRMVGELLRYHQRRAMTPRR